MTVREQILESLQQTLELIRPGYQAGDHTCSAPLKGVFPWRKAPLTVTDCPALLIFDTSAEAIDGTLDGTTYRLRLEIVGVVTAASPASSARNLLADILAVIGQNSDLDGHAQIIGIENQTLTRDDAGDIIGAVDLTLSITYTAAQWRI